MTAIHTTGSDSCLDFFVRSVRARISFSFAIYSAGSHTLHSQDTASAACTTAQSTNPFAARPFFPRKQKCLSRMSEFTLPFLRVGAHSMCRAMDGADTELLRNSQEFLGRMSCSDSFR